MSIAKFIMSQRAAILFDWERFADALTPERPDLTAEQLRDFAGSLLDSIGGFLESKDTRDRPEGPRILPVEVKASAEAHASHRLQQHFTLKQMVAEYRGLRASVAHRWIESLENGGVVELDELSRFDMAVDLSLAVSVAWYHDRLQEAQEELRAADRAKDEFLTVLGHELRNPLAPLRTGLDLLERARSRPGLLESLGPMMERQFPHLVHLVDDLLDLARISRGQINLQLASLDLNAAIEAAVEQVDPTIRERQHQFRLELADEPLMVNGDLERLTQVAANLLSNACKYSEPRGNIFVQSEAVDGQAVLRVRDSGFGIPPSGSTAFSTS